MIILAIDTSDNKKTTVQLQGDTKDSIERVTQNHASQVVLSLIDEILKKNRLSLSEINGIEINNGPGSFTGLRVGVAIANALGFAQKISVNGRSLGDYPQINYT